MSDRGDDKETGFLRRWSRLKSEDRPAQSDRAEEKALAPVEDAAPPDGEEAALDEAAIAELPDIDSLDKDSDYTVFLRDGVPEALRQRALRKLWLSDPVLANLDGLNDYDDDFGTIYREGAAFMKRLADAGERMTRPGAEDDPPEESDSEEIVDSVAEAGPAEVGADPAAPEAGKNRDEA